MIRALAAACLLLAPASARAQHRNLPSFAPGMGSYGLRLGAAAPTAANGFNKVCGSGPAIDLEGQYFPFDWIALGTELNLSEFGANSRGSASALNLGLFVRMNLFQNRSWTPYVLGGAGKHKFSTKPKAGATGDSACNPLNGACGAEAKFAASSLSLMAGAGIETFLIRGLSVSFDVRYRQYRFAAGHADSLGYALGLRRWFGF